jgi:hypothetical protein
MLGTCCQKLVINFFFFPIFGKITVIFPQKSYVCVEIIVLRVEKTAKKSLKKQWIDK